MIVKNISENFKYKSDSFDLVENINKKRENKNKYFNKKNFNEINYKFNKFEMFWFLLQKVWIMANVSLKVH